MERGIVFESSRESPRRFREDGARGSKRMQYAPKLSGVVLVEHEDGVLRIPLVARRSARVLGERVDDLADD